jgi:hypothetical protein
MKSMRNELRRQWLLGAVLSAAAAALPAQADACVTGTIEVVGVNPNPVYVTNFASPFELVVSMEASGSGMNFNSLAPIRLWFNEAEVHAFDFEVSGIDNQSAEATFSASVPGPGDYTLSVVGKRGATDYCDEEEVSAIQLVAVEFKAPPALANEYINAHYSRLNGKRRGCVVSAIAQNHAKLSLYGPKGGDAALGPYGYELWKIQQDVDALLSNVCL